MVFIGTRSRFWLERETGRLKQGNEDLIATQDIPLQGLHNAANVMAAVALCEAVGLPREALLEHVKTFQGLPHRVEKIGEKNGVVFITTAKARMSVRPLLRLPVCKIRYS